MGGDSGHFRPVGAYSLVFCLLSYNDRDRRPKRIRASGWTIISRARGERFLLANLTDFSELSSTIGITPSAQGNVLLTN